MIKKMLIENFKCFKKYQIELEKTQLLIGANNSGKTTIFHALQTFFWCLEGSADVGSGSVTFRKTQLPEVGAIPYFNMKDLFFNQKMRTGRRPTRIKLGLETSVAPPLAFEIYPAFSRNIMVDGGNRSILLKEYKNLIKLKPTYIPSTIGIVTREELYRPIYQDRLISEGRHNLILRNLLYRLSKSRQWAEYCRMIENLFNVRDIEVPFDETTDEWLTSVYKEEGRYDFISAGSGFIQVASILAFLFLNPTKVVLIDEPDSHMHDDLQRLVFNILKEVGNKKDLQIIVATHSPTLIDAADLESILVIDNKTENPLKPKNVDQLIPILTDHGLALPHRKIVEALSCKKVLFVEGKEADFDRFIKIIGPKLYTDFLIKIKQLIVFQTEGATKEWPLKAIKVFEDLLGSPLEYIFIRDRDYLLDGQVQEMQSAVTNPKHKICFLENRNRESYILNPRFISRIVTEKWKKSNPRKKMPEYMAEAEVASFILKEAREDQIYVEASFMQCQEPYLKVDASEKHKRLQELIQFFKIQYTDPLAENKIPYRLLDSKKILRKMRGFYAEKARVLFSDKEILEKYDKKDIPKALQQIIKDIYDMYK